MVGPRFQDLSGQIFGRVTVRELSGKDKFGRCKWLVDCSCGGSKIIHARHLKSGLVKSCGCLKSEAARKSGKRGAYKISGKLSHLYNMDLTDEERLKRRNLQHVRQWRDKVFAKDDYTCVACGVRGGKMCAHHLYSWASYPEHRFSVENGQTMCKRCHKGFHNWMGGFRVPCKPCDLQWYIDRVLEFPNDE